MKRKTVRKRGYNTGGFTLVETVVSGGLLLLLALMMARGFAVCNHLMLRNRQFREADERLEEQIVREYPPDERTHVTLEAGEYGAWDVVIDTYESKAEQIDITFKILRNEDNEK